MCGFSIFFFFLIVNREVQHAACGYIPRSSWVRLSGPGCPPQVQPAYVWQRLRHSPVRGLRRTPRSTASVCRSPALRRAGKASPRWRCPAASTGRIQMVSRGNTLQCVTSLQTKCCSTCWHSPITRGNHVYSFDWILQLPLHDEKWLNTKLVTPLAVGQQLIMILTFSSFY